jgi:hypothetical protein
VLTDDMRTQRDVLGIAALRRRAEAMWCWAETIRLANARHANVQREWLYHRLCGIWLDYYAPGLTYTRPSLGGPPSGPLIKFMRAAMQQILPEDKLPKPETMSDAIDRERRVRERAKQLYFDFVRRRAQTPNGGLTLEK